MFELTEDYDKAIIPYQTKTFALNVTAEINLRSFKLHKKSGNNRNTTSGFHWLILRNILYVKEAEMKIGLETTLSFLWKVFLPALLSSSWCLKDFFSG